MLFFVFCFFSVFLLCFVFVLIKFRLVTVKRPLKNKNQRHFFYFYTIRDQIAFFFSIILFAIYKEADPNENTNNTKERGLQNERLRSTPWKFSHSALTVPKLVLDR